MPGRQDDKIRCSFCGKTQDQVRKLIAGSDKDIAEIACEVGYSDIKYFSKVTIVLNFAQRFWKRSLRTEVAKGRISVRSTC